MPWDRRSWAPEERSKGRHAERVRASWPAGSRARRSASPNNSWSDGCMEPSMSSFDLMDHLRAYRRWTKDETPRQGVKFGKTYHSHSWGIPAGRIRRRYEEFVKYGNLPFRHECAKKIPITQRHAKMIFLLIERKAIGRQPVRGDPALDDSRIGRGPVDLVRKFKYRML